MKAKSTTKYGLYRTNHSYDWIVEIMVLKHQVLGDISDYDIPPIWPIMCLVGR